MADTCSHYSGDDQKTYQDAFTSQQQHLIIHTLVTGVDPLCDEQAAGLRFGSVRVSDGELVGREAKRVVAHVASLRPVRADPTEHGLLLSAVDWRGHWRQEETR